MTTINYKAQKKRLKLIDRADYLTQKMIEIYNSGKYKNDENFALSEEVQMLKNETLNILTVSGVKITYKNLTDINKHHLVKILNYRNELKIKKSMKVELKTFSIF